MTAITSIYRRLVPSGFRARIWQGRKVWTRRMRDVRWRLLPRSINRRLAERRLNCRDRGWAFIVGCNNSGTTLLQNVLGSHPQVKSLPREGQRLTRELPFPPDLGVGRTFTRREDVFRWTADERQADPDRIRYDWSFHVSREPGLLLEKSPTNTLRSLWLQANFHPARFLVLTRHPYAVCEGIRRRRGNSLVEAATHWRKVHQAVDADLAEIDRAVVTKYEDFCADPLTRLADFEDFLGLDRWFDAEFVSREFTAHNRYASPRGIQDFNRQSIEMLSAEERATIDQICAPMMSRFGYSPTTQNEEVAQRDGNSVLQEQDCP